jgi:hypothetical protein
MVLALVGLAAVCLAVGLAIVPSRYDRTIGTVQAVQPGNRATLAYTVDGSEYMAYMSFKDQTSPGTFVDVTYLKSDPTHYEHARIRRSMLVTFILIAAAVTFILAVFAA